MAFWNNNNDDDARRRSEYDNSPQSGQYGGYGRPREESNFDARYSRSPSGDDGLRRRLGELPPLSRQNNELPPIQRSSTYYDNMPQQQVVPAAPIASPPYVPPINSGAGNVVITSPETYSDVQNLIDYLKMSRPLIIDFCKVNGESAQRILDFMSGAIYALSGSMQRISQTIFLLTPAGVSITIPVEQLKKCAEEQQQKKKK